MDNFNIHTFDVGQGLFNFVCERYKDGEKEKTYCGIIDCGSHIRTKKNYQLRIKDIANKMKAEYKNAPLDYVFISHQDEDHWNYLLDFLEYYYDFSFYDWNTKLETHGFKSLFRLRKENYESRQYSWLEQCIFFRDNYYFTRTYFINDYFDICNGNFPEMRISIEGENIEYTFSLNTKCNIALNTCQGKKKSIQVQKVKITTGLISKEWTCKEPFDINNINKEIIALYLAKTRIFGEMKATAIQSMLEKIMLSMIIDVETITKNNGKKINIGQIKVGGLNWGVEAIKFKKKLGAIEFVQDCPCCLYRIENRRLNPDLYVELNGIRKRKNDSIKKNASSMMVHYICDVDGDKFNAFFPGDATHHTFDRCNEKLEGIKIDYLVAPHHGSYKTNVVVDEDKQPSENQPVDQFVSRTRPKDVVFSARHNVFGHPNNIAAEKITKNVEEKMEQHQYVTFKENFPSKLDVKRGDTGCCWTDTEKKMCTTEFNEDIFFENGTISFTKGKTVLASYEQGDNDLILFDDMFI
ncbi:MAG: hypothetical protein PHY47_13405 [Lachnospiraceae bacterium]|nr:hypothetical protein [Lachnospiraceae bacterium]